VAARLRGDPDATARLLSAMVVLGLCTREGERFASTELGRCLESEHPTSRRAWARLMGGPGVWTAWGKLADAVRTGRPALADPFDDLEADAEGAAVFHRAMLELTRGSAPAIAAVLPYEGVRRVCDLGGGSGALLCAVLETRPELEGVVLDQPSARAGAEALFAARGLAGRARFVDGDLFRDPLPPAELYLLKSVIHDWDDARSLAILRRCGGTLPGGARLALVEAPAPPPGTPGIAGTPAEWFLAFSDLNMLLVTGGRERSAAEYRALLEAAGLRVVAERAAGGFYAVIEAARAT
jgi:hypothetical protein